MNLDIKVYEKDLNVTGEYIESHADEILNDLSKAKENYSNDLLGKLDNQREIYDFSVKVIEDWFDNEKDKVKGEWENGIFHPNVVSVIATAKRIVKKHDGVYQFEGNVRFNNGFTLHFLNSNFYSDTLDDVLLRAKISYVEQVLNLIKKEKQLYFIENDNYEKKSREMHDFMWNYRLDFNNRIFNKSRISDEELEKSWAFYQEIKKDMERIEEKVRKFNEKI